MGAWMILWGVVGLVLLALFIVGLLFLIRALSGNTASKAPDVETPQDILRRRYAAGEIDEDDYMRRLSGLGHS
ncbi:SHOCT domain-containing protein [Streptomyces sp. NPDC049597]|uniref:SHOCT domain-containing protein n=1 Tax=Streptomyces sp. NPDC049597 TaxID=3155276 RepID=UPI0034436C01